MGHRRPRPPSHPPPADASHPAMPSLSDVPHAVVQYVAAQGRHPSEAASEMSQRRPRPPSHAPPAGAFQPAVAPSKDVVQNVAAHRRQPTEAPFEMIQGRPRPPPHRQHAAFSDCTSVFFFSTLRNSVKPAASDFCLDAPVERRNYFSCCLCARLVLHPGAHMFAFRSPRACCLLLVQHA